MSTGLESSIKIFNDFEKLFFNCFVIFYDSKILIVANVY